MEDNNCIILIGMGSNYKIYIPYFILSLYYTNNVCDILILTDDSYIKMFEEAFNYVKTLYETKTKKKIKFIDYNYYNNMFDISFPIDNEYTMYHGWKISKAKYFRWLMTPIIYEDYDYVYIGDIDLFICENDIFEKHKNHLEKNNTSFSNIIREEYGNTYRLSGLHFFKVKEYLNKYRNKIINYSQEDYNKILNKTLILYKNRNKKIYFENEIILYSLIDDDELKNLKYNYGDFHGIHIGCLRYYNKMNYTKKNKEILDLINTSSLGDIIYYINGLKILINKIEFRFIHSLLNDSVVNLLYMVYNEEYNIKIISQDQPTKGGFGTVAYTLNNSLKNCKLNVNLYYLNVDCKNSNEDNIQYVNIKDLNQIIAQIVLQKNVKIDYKELNKNLKIKNNDIIVSCTPIVLYIICYLKDFLKLNFKHYYCCGSLPINWNLYKNTNFFNLIENTHDINSILNSNRILNNTMRQNKTYEIIPNSILLKNLCNKIKEKEESSIVIHKNLDGQLTDLNYIFNNKKVFDLIFVCSDLNRAVKNFDLILNIYKKYPKLKKVIIGKNSNKYEYLENTLVFETLSNKWVNTYLSKSKISLCASFIDAGPSTVMESILNNCIPLSSFNCGFSKLLHGFSLSPYIIDEWYEKINSILNSYSKESKYIKMLDLCKYKIINNKVDFLKILMSKQ